MQVFEETPHGKVTLKSEKLCGFSDYPVTTQQHSLAQAAQRGCECPVPGGVRDQVR